ncbi:hypothetical protein QFC24_006982 [Naganishia onofrii]|uniref:Uncharacterized protein n=1 Tax=Naganishia onofrii TaxID=1851511 RepID=A0ACC2WXW6_9TREE|nr:hypothetical protein QFC24_006982 [Naganishia onofrii]
METPFRQKAMADEALGHTICKDMSAMMSMLQVTGLLGREEAEEGKAAKALESTPPEAKDCRELVRTPRIRPISDIGQVELAKADAKLHGCSPSRLANVQSSFRLHNTEIKTVGKVTYGNCISTRIESLKLAAMQRDPKQLAEVERSMMQEYGWGNTRFESLTCMMRLRYAEWHLNLPLDLSLVRLFIPKLRGANVYKKFQRYLTPSLPVSSAQSQNRNASQDAPQSTAHQSYRENRSRRDIRYPRQSPKDLRFEVYWHAPCTTLQIRPARARSMRHCRQFIRSD